MNEKSHIFAESIIRKSPSDTSFMDSDNIVWKVIDDKFIGKRSVQTLDFRACWLEDTTIQNVKSWWCGKDSDYSEIFNGGE